MNTEIQKAINNKKYSEHLFKMHVKKKLIKQDSFNYKKHLDKAISNLDLANFLFEEHKYSIKNKLPNRTYYDWCLTIYYYALYHSALTLISKLGFKSSSHLATINTIILFYYHKKLIKENDLTFLIEKINIKEEELDLIQETKDLRERASYNANENFNIKITKLTQIKTANFINKIQQSMNN